MAQHQMTKLLKRPRDPAQIAKLMIDIASGQVEDREPTPETGLRSHEASSRRGPCAMGRT